MLKMLAMFSLFCMCPILAAPAKPTPQRDIVPPRPFKIHWEFRIWEPSTFEPSELLAARHWRQKILPAVEAVIAQSVQVKYPIKMLQLTPYCKTSPPWSYADVSTYAGLYPINGECDEVFYEKGDVFFPFQIPQRLIKPNYVTVKAGTPPTGGSGVEADFVIMVTWLRGSGGFAWDVCAQDLEDTFRPTCMQLNIPVGGPPLVLPSSVADLNPYYARRVSKVLSKTWSTMGLLPQYLQGKYGYINNDNTDWINPVRVFQRDGFSVSQLTTPPVVREVRKHFGCPTTQGAELENDFGTIAAGLEGRLFRNSIANTMNSPDNAVDIMTRIDLAVLEGTGWYTVSYKLAGYNPFGHLAGCTFADGTFADIAMSKSAAVARHFCTPATPVREFIFGQASCGNDATTVTQCFPGLELTDDNVPLNFDQGYVDSCTLAPASSALGEEPRRAEGVYGPKSRCLLGANVDSFAGAGCVEMRCKNSVLEVKLDNLSFICPSGKNVTVTVNSETRVYGPCPDNNLFCGLVPPARGWLECSSACLAHGTCLRGQCKCFPGWAGSDCQARVCIDNGACPSGKVCDLGLGYCVLGN